MAATKSIRNFNLLLRRKALIIIATLAVLLIGATYAVSLMGTRIYTDKNNLFEIKIPNSWSVTEIDGGVHINKFGGGLAMEIVVRRDPTVKPSVLFSTSTENALRQKYSKSYKIKPSEVTFSSAIIDSHSALVVHFADKSQKGKVTSYSQYHILKGEFVYVITRNNTVNESVLKDFKLL